MKAMLLQGVLSVVFLRHVPVPRNFSQHSHFLTAGLFITLLACVLVPVDVFLISYMKNPDGESY
jgi:hypothetical protein